MRRRFKGRMPVCDEKKGHTDPSFTPTSEPRSAKDTMTFGCPKWKTIARCRDYCIEIFCLCTKREKAQMENCSFFLLIELTYI